MADFEAYRQKLITERFFAAAVYMAIPFYLSFTIVDWIFVPQLWSRFLAIRALSCVFIAGLVIVVKLLRLNDRLMPWMSHVVTGVLGLGLGYIIFRTGGLQSPYYVGLSWVVMGSVAFFPYRAVDILICICTIYSPLLILVGPSVGLDSSVFVLHLIFMIGASIVAIIASTFTLRSLEQKHQTESLLEEQRAQSEALLHEMLPESVIDRIRGGAKNIAESLSEVSVIFIDVVGFSAMARRLAPKHLVEILGEMFWEFDENCAKLGIMKIKTIGDAYMAATCGSEDSAPSAAAAVKFCLNAIDSVDRIARSTGVPIHVRAGIATGTVISGVLSLKRPAYDLWGETVNLAARLESSGEQGRVHIAETTYWRVKNEFPCESRGTIHVRGIGLTQTYFVLAQ